MSDRIHMLTTNYRKQLIAGATAFLLAGMTHAAQVVVTFTGIITDSWDMTGSTFGAGQGYSTLRGKTVVQEFTFDSAVRPSRLDTEPLSAQYALPFSPTTLSASWINVKTTVDGLVIAGPTSETPGPTAYINIDSLTISDGYSPSLAMGFGMLDYFYIDQGSVNLVHGASSDLYTTAMSVVSVQQEGNFIEGVSLDQQFTLANDYVHGYGRANWGVVSVTNGTSTTVNEGYVHYLVKSATYKTVSAVPEPSSLILLFIGMAMLGAMRRHATSN